MIIIVIIVGGTIGLATAFWPIAFVFALMFSGDGDAVPGTINEIQKDTLCYPSPETFMTLRSLGQSMDNSGIKYNEDIVEKTLKKHGVIHVKEGVDVKVVKEGTFLRLGPSFAVSLTPVLLTDASKIRVM